MNKLWSMIVLIVILIGGGGVIFLIRYQSRKLPEFSIRNGAKIDRLILKNSQHEVHIKKTKKGWILNDSLMARKESVSAFLDMMEQLTIKSPLGMQEREKFTVNHDPITLNLFSNGIRIQSFLIYYLPDLPIGNFAQKTDKANSYILQYPGYSGNLAAWFNCDENYWKPVDLFKYETNEISSVECKHHEQPLKSFLIRRDPNTGFEMIDPTTSVEILGIAQEQAARYFSYFHSIQFDRFVSSKDLEKLGLKKANNPRFYFEVTDTSGMKKTVESYPLFNVSGDTTYKEENHDWTLLYISHESDPVLIRYFSLDPIIKSRNYFIKQ